MNQTNLTNQIKALAISKGIDVLGITHASPFHDYSIQDSVRRNSLLSMPDAKTIIVAGIYIGGITLPVWPNKNYGRTSRLFLSGFFLDIVKPLLTLSEFLKQHGYMSIICESSSTEGSIIPLKMAAVRAGMGWQGKHSLLVTKKYGTYLALGGILTNADLDHHTQKEKNRCLKCNKCQVVCPMNALEIPHILKKTKCLSFLLQTDNLPHDAKNALNNQIMDCEICQDTCPWNKKHQEKPLDTKFTQKFQSEIPQWNEFFHFSNLKDLTAKEYNKALDHLHTTIPYSIFHRNVEVGIKNQST